MDLESHGKQSESNILNKNVTKVLSQYRKNFTKSEVWEMTYLKRCSGVLKLSINLCAHTGINCEQMLNTI